MSIARTSKKKQITTPQHAYPSGLTVEPIEMPTGINILGKPFTVLCEEANETPSSPLDRGDMGACAQALLRIYVRAGFPLHTQQDTLLHETLHAISDELQLDMAERQVATTATVLLDTLRRNPQLAAYLLQP